MVIIMVVVTTTTARSRSWLLLKLCVTGLHPEPYNVLLLGLWQHQADTGVATWLSLGLSLVIYRTDFPLSLPNKADDAWKTPGRALGEFDAGYTWKVTWYPKPGAPLSPFFVPPSCFSCKRLKSCLFWALGCLLSQNLWALPSTLPVWAGNAMPYCLAS